MSEGEAPWSSRLDACLRCQIALPNVRAKLTAKVCDAWPREVNSPLALEWPSNACRSGSA